MDYQTYSQKLDHLKWLAQRKMTGSPKELAKKLEVSPRTIKRMVMRLREEGIEIHYCRKNQSYIIRK